MSVLEIPARRALARQRAAAPVAPGVLRQALLLARRDLQAERRSGDVLRVTVPFAAAVLVLLALSVGADRPLLRQLGPGVYWAVVLVFGTMVAMRVTGDDVAALRDHDTLLGFDPVARVLARVLAGSGLLLAVEVGLLPVAIAVYDPDLVGWVWLALLDPLVALGLGALGAVIAGLTRSVSGRTGIGSLLTLPLAVPLCLAATQVLAGARYGASAVPWLVLIGAVDVVVLLMGAASARILEEGE